MVTYAYNAQGQMIYQKDQGGNELEFVYDDAGRESYRKVTTVGSGFDSTIRRISRTYDDLGRPVLVTQASDTSGSTVTDETKYNYDSWGMISKFQIDRNSAVAGGGGDEYNVSYAYEKATAGRQTVRRTTQTLPSGKDITYSYSSTPLHDNELSRVTAVKDGGTRLCTYLYNQVGQVVGQVYDEADVYNKQYTTTPGNYADLDQFGRVTRSRWTKDLSTDKDFYKVELTYDRNSNITWAEDKVHTGFDVKYDIDALNRVTKADEGTKSGGSITSRKREQEWTLSQTGNWSVAKLDVNGDGDFVDTNEYNDTRTHNKANEITGQDTDSNSSDNYTPVYDPVGNMTDDNHNYKYVYDPFGRVVTVKNQSNATIAEYKYNGLGFRIAFHEDSDTDGDVDGSDKWYYLMYDESWRLLSVFRESDTSPKEEFVVHNAGLDGFGGSSMLDGVICRYKDSTSVFTHASDGVLEEKVYICQNWRGDVSAIVTSDGKMKEWVKYSAYGIPFAMPAGDTDSDGDCDTTDVGQILTWKNGSVYDVRGDLDLDGDVDATDRTTAIASYQGTTLGWGILSNIGNRKGYAGYERDINFGKTWHVRNRVLDSELGRWTRRDPMGYIHDANLQNYGIGNPLRLIDPFGLNCSVPGNHGNSNYVSNAMGLSQEPQGNWPSIGIPTYFGYLSCCERIRQGFESAGVEVPGGIVGCCDGEKVICIYAYEGVPLATDLLRNVILKIQGCILQHELTHLDEVYCPRDSTGPALWNPGTSTHDQADHENKGFETESNCLDQVESECQNASTSEEVAQCNQLIRHRQRVLRAWISGTIDPLKETPPIPAANHPQPQPNWP